MEIFYLEDGGSWFFWKAVSYQHMTSQSKRQLYYIRVNRKVAGMLLFIQGKDNCKGIKNENH
jgi:hypothetical protein